MRLHWYGTRYGDRYTSVEEARQAEERRVAKEREINEEIRHRLQGMNAEEREHYLETMR